MLTSEKLSDRGALKSPRPSADVIDPKSLGSDDVEAVGDGGVGSESRSASSCTPFAAICAAHATFVGRFADVSDEPLTGCAHSGTSQAQMRST